MERLVEWTAVERDCCGEADGVDCCGEAGGVDCCGEMEADGADKLDS